MTSLQKACEVFSIGIDEMNHDFITEKFKTLVKSNHPDINTESDIKDIGFLVECRNILIAHCKENEQIKNVLTRKIEKEDCFMTNKKFCEECDGYGEKPKHEHVQRLDLCQTCSGIGYVIKCSRCKDGTFTHKDGKVVKCKFCKGTQIFAKVSIQNIVSNRKNIVVCPTCRGIRIHLVSTLRTFKSPCYSCRGQGYTEAKNPLIKEGSILSKGA